MTQVSLFAFGYIPVSTGYPSKQGLGPLVAMDRCMTTKYVVRIDAVRGTEEYDAGTTIKAARAEAAFFIEHTPAHVGVRICKIVSGDQITLVEVAR